MGSFTDKEASVNALYKKIASISEGIAHPFFDIEVKTSGVFEEAVDVACTGGAAMVQAHRHLQALVRSTDSKSKDSKTKGPSDNEPYADMSTIAYSMVLMPSIASIYVHWAEVKGEQVVYHMHLVDSYAIAVERQLKDCRAAVKNVLDWGLGERRKAINGLLRTIYERHEKTTMAAKDKGKSASGASGGMNQSPSKDQPPASKKHRRSVDEDEGDQ